MQLTTSVIHDSYTRVRSYISQQEYVENLALFAVALKDKREKIDDFNKLGSENQLVESKDIYKDGKKFLPAYKELHETTSKEVVKEILCTLASAQDALTFVKCLREYCAIYLKGYDYIVPSDNEVRLLQTLVGDCHNKVICDPALGFACTVSALQPQKIYGNEINPFIYRVASACLYLENKEFDISLGDSLYSTQLPIKQADIVVLTPPLGQKLAPSVRDRGFQSLVEGSVPASGSDSLWIQLALSCLNSEGKAYILLPQGCLFRGGYDARVRDALLEKEYIEAIIGLPANILSGTKIPTSVLILNKNRTKGAPIHFVDASKFGAKKANRVVLSKENCELIATLAKGKLLDNEHFIAQYLSDIRQKNGGKGNDLSVSRYIEKIEEKNSAPCLDLKEEMMKLEAVQVEFDEAQRALQELLNR